MSNILRCCLGNRLYLPHTHTHTPHTDDHVNITANPLGVCGEQVSLRGLQSCIQHHWFHLRVDLVKILHRVNVGDVPRVPNIIDVFKKGFTLDL